MDGDAQTKLESRIEVFLNYFSGFIIAWCAWFLLVKGPMAWEWFTIDDTTIITSIFTVVSLIRSYFWRRFFANGLHRVVHKFVVGVVA